MALIEIDGLPNLKMVDLSIAMLVITRVTMFNPPKPMGFSQVWFQDVPSEKSLDHRHFFLDLLKGFLKNKKSSL